MLSIVDVDGNSPIIDLDLGDIEPAGWVMPRPPDGEELIFTGRPNPGLKDLGLFAIRPGSTGPRTIGEPSTTTDPDLSFQNPVLSPDGKTIAFWNWEPGPNGEPPDGHLHLRDLDTGAELPVPFAPDHLGNGPRYSPDGKMVIYESALPGLTYAPTDGSLPARSIGPAYSYLNRQGFDFSPDGTKVILSLIGRNTLIDIATGKFAGLADIPTTPVWQRLAPLAP